MDNFFINNAHAELTLNSEENVFLNKEKIDKKWELVGITETEKSNSQFSKNKNRFIYHIKNRISNRYHQYSLGKVNMASINLICHATPKCRSMLNMEIGNFKYKNFNIFVYFFNKNWVCSKPPGLI